MESARYRFGLFEFDTSNLELRRQGALVRLQAQPARVLACLLEHPDQVVLRDELRQAIWGNETFVDFERGLNFAISQIRSALRDDSAEPIYVRTVPKSGYQFIAPIERMSNRPVQPPRGPLAKIAVGFAAVALAAIALYAFHFRSVHSASKPPILAVLRFDNETGDPSLARFSDALTDNVVEQLTRASGGRYRVIGNAQILRLPREQRDLRAVGSTLHAAYVVLGQVQSSGEEVRILAHLIRLPDQTHIWVARMDRSLERPLDVESDVAQKIADEFSPRILADPRRAPSLPPATP